MAVEQHRVNVRAHGTVVSGYLRSALHIDARVLSETPTDWMAVAGVRWESERTTTASELPVGRC
jgi:hypothetical protein